MAKKKPVKIKKGDAAFRTSKDNGLGIEVSYEDLHHEINKLQRRLTAIRTQRLKLSMNVDRVDDVLLSLKKCFDGTQCQVNMLEGY